MSKSSSASRPASAGSVTHRPGSLNHGAIGAFEGFMGAGTMKGGSADTWAESTAPKEQKQPFSYSILEDMRLRRKRRQSQEWQDQQTWQSDQKRKNSMENISIAGFQEKHPQNEAQNGWQMRRENVKDRVSILFNNPVMSDVLFRIEGKVIPAHKFMLASTSPVFYSRLYETKGLLSMWAPSVRSRNSTFSLGHNDRNTTIIDVTGVSAGAFFEFIRFIYTDEAKITLEISQELCMLADDYRVAGLHEKVMDYIQTVIVKPDQSFTCLAILKNIFLKQMIYFWRDLTESKQCVEGLASRPSSGFTDRKSVTPGQSRCHSACSHTSNTSRISSVGSVHRKEEHYIKHSKKSRQMSYKLASVIKDLAVLGWQAIDRETEDALTSKSFLEVDYDTLLELLERRKCSVPEIALFRAIIRWIDVQCDKKGLQRSGINRRAILGEKGLRGIRFPVMTAEQIQWEVVPTGVLPFEEVKPLLSYKDSAAATLLRYTTIPREGNQVRDLPVNRERQSLHPLRPTTPLLEPTENDEIDQLLSSALFCQELRRQHDNVGRGSKIFRRGLLGHSSIESERPPRRAEDFDRVAPGLYRYQDTSILRLCIEGGEVMVYELGTVYPGEPVDVEHFYRIVARGMGTPLSAFL